MSTNRGPAASTDTSAHAPIRPAIVATRIPWRLTRLRAGPTLTPFSSPKGDSMFRTSSHAVRLCVLIAMIVSLPVSVGHAQSKGRAAYRVRVLPTEFPFVTGFNDRQHVIGYAPQDLTMPFDINKHGEVVGLPRTDPASARAFLRLRSGRLVDLGAFGASGSSAPTGGAFLWTPDTGMENLG